MSRKRLGWVIFVTSSGCVCDDRFELFEKKKDAVAKATEIIDSYWDNDRYANPDHEYYVPVCDEELRIDYDELYTAALTLRSASLNADNDLIIMPVFPVKKTKKKEKTNATKTKNKK